MPLGKQDHARATQMNNKLKRNVLRKSGEVAWLTAREQGMTTLRRKDKKHVYFLTTIHSSPVTPAWVAGGDSGSNTDAVRNESNVVSRRCGDTGSPSYSLIVA